MNTLRVANEVASLGEPLHANAADKWSLIRMNTASVPREVTTLRKPLQTLLTRERSLSSVDHHVACQVACLHEPLSAHITPVYKETQTQM
jgi:hypothetical protein